MRIGLVVHHELDPDSGAPGITHELCMQYRAAGHDACVYSHTDLPRMLPARLKTFLFPLFVAAHLARAVRRRRVEVVDASTGDSWLWSLLDPARRRVLLVTRSHGLEHVNVAQNRESARRGELDLSWKYPLYHGGPHLREVEATLRRADLAFLNNREDEEYAVRELGVERHRVRRVPDGIRNAFLGLPLDLTSGRPDGPIRIAQIGSYIDRKGIHYGAPALATILRRWPHTHLTFFGTGVPPRLVYVDFPPDVHDRIGVVQHYENPRLASVLRGYQITVFPSLAEGFGVGLLEAMACGLAPIATATSGVLEFVRDGDNGLVVPLRDADAIVAAFEKLVADPALMDSIRRRAHETAQGYTWRRAAELQLGFYAAALRQRKGGGS